MKEQDYERIVRVATEEKDLAREERSEWRWRAAQRLYSIATQLYYGRRRDRDDETNLTPPWRRQPQRHD